LGTKISFRRARHSWVGPVFIAGALFIDQAFTSQVLVRAARWVFDHRNWVLPIPTFWIVYHLWVSYIQYVCFPRSRLVMIVAQVIGLMTALILTGILWEFTP
jgi:hypothetical protein